jgi:hypothetical protein
LGGFGGRKAGKAGLAAQRRLLPVAMIHDRIAVTDSAYSRSQ